MCLWQLCKLQRLLNFGSFLGVTFCCWLVDLSVTIMQVTVSVAVMQMGVSVAIMQVAFSAVDNAHASFYCNYAGGSFFLQLCR